MEKLKAKHDHKLTDILKVFIFGLFLIMPGIFMLPSIMYYGVNKYATAPTKTTEVYEERQVDFNQLRQSFTDVNTTYAINDNNQTLIINGTTTGRTTFAYAKSGTENNYFNFYVNHKYYIPCDIENSLRIHTVGWEINVNRFNQLVTCSSTILNTNLVIETLDVETYDYLSFNCMVYDLTQMFGEGNEPTILEFNEYYYNVYYPYTESKLEMITINTGQTETYTDITSQIQYNWTSLWEQPLFSWTNYTILKQGIDNFTNVFGVTNTSNITNLIVYELIIVAIYIVIDIVIEMFKWLTHLIGTK